MTSNLRPRVEGAPCTAVVAERASRHVAIIMDGNAAGTPARGLPARSGPVAPARRRFGKALKPAVKNGGSKCLRWQLLLGIGAGCEEEVSDLSGGLLDYYLERELDELLQARASSFDLIGDLAAFGRSWSSGLERARREKPPAMTG